MEKKFERVAVVVWKNPDRILIQETVPLQDLEIVFSGQEASARVLYWGKLEIEEVIFYKVIEL